MASCANCGAKLPKQSRYCPQCGNPSETGATKVMEVPLDETGPVPVQYASVEARYYGIMPSTLVLVLAGIALAFAVVLFVIGHWPFGLILVGVGLLLVLLFLEAARRKPQGTVARTTTGAVDSFRARAGGAADSFATRGRAARQLIALRRELKGIGVLRARLLFELGDAVYRGDDQATETARGQVRDLDELAAQKEADMQTVVARAQERLQRRRLEVQPTEMVELPDRPSPAPAPGEGNPPEPARIPEPYPPPDEGNPPQPAVIPEPGPAVIPEPGPQSEERR